MGLLDACPVGCGRKHNKGKLMCLQCWREVPAELQREVNRTFKAWWADTRNGDKFSAYLSAKNAAIGSIR
jgi:hypothetical protein